MRWGTGETTVERLLVAGHVERVHEEASAAEAAETLGIAGEIIDAAAKLVPNLGFF
jgi:hypothetical protein